MKVIFITLVVAIAVGCFSDPTPTPSLPTISTKYDAIAQVKNYFAQRPFFESPFDDEPTEMSCLELMEQWAEEGGSPIKWDASFQQIARMSAWTVTFEFDMRGQTEKRLLKF